MLLVGGAGAELVEGAHPVVKPALPMPSTMYFALGGRALPARRPGRLSTGKSSRAGSRSRAAPVIAA